MIVQTIGTNKAKKKSVVLPSVNDPSPKIKLKKKKKKTRVGNAPNFYQIGCFFTFFEKKGEKCTQILYFWVL